MRVKNKWKSYDCKNNLIQPGETMPRKKSTKSKSKKSKVVSPETNEEITFEKFSDNEDSIDFQGFNVEISNPVVAEPSMNKVESKGGLLTTMGQIASENKFLTLAILAGGGYGIYSILSQNTARPVPTGSPNRRPLPPNFQDALGDLDDDNLTLDDDEFENILFDDGEDSKNNNIKAEFQPLSFG